MVKMANTRKLTDSQILEIFHSNLYNTQLAVIYNVSGHTINCIKNKKTHKDLLCTSQRKEHSKNDLVSCLTQREEEVLELLAQGITYKGVAKQLFISPTTVKTHVNNIFQKLQVNDRTQAVVYAINKKKDKEESLLNLNEIKPKVYLKEALSDIEKDILQRLSIGLNVGQVADCVKLSPSEVVVMLQNFFKKLEI